MPYNNFIYPYFELNEEKKNSENFKKTLIYIKRWLQSTDENKMSVLWFPFFKINICFG